ncbi:MAG TPA: lipid-A-disaccharide synthase [Candidatus Krumholzibacteria bacterium]|nr:lipid-A-disaccharide synthase [Candidatus Krumholzibacteria bacterium]
MRHSTGMVLCAGELSGDMHAAHVVRALRAAGVGVTGIAGTHCAAAGMDVRFHHRDYAVIGFTGVVAALPKFYRLERAMKSLIDGASLFLAVDYPGLNLRLCEYAKRRGVPVLYYIAPQVWAWGAKRVERMKRCVDQVAVVLPFEAEIYRRAGVPVEFVGHPFIVDHELPDPRAQTQRKGIALLPGSRESEVRHMLPVVIAAAEEIARARPGTTFVIAQSPVVDERVYRDALRTRQLDAHLEPDAVVALSGARVAVVASGTATLQSALLETPLVVVYRTTAINYALARRMVTIDNIGLVNVLLGERVAPELVQGDARPAAIAQAVLNLAEDAPRRTAMLERFRELRISLAGGRGAERVAEMAMALASRRGAR